MNLPFKSASKTGTSTGFRDSLVIGYTSEFVVGVWVGNNDNTAMYGINGVQGAGKIWHDTMLLVHEYYQTEYGIFDFDIDKPDRVKEFTYCIDANGFDDVCSNQQSDIFLETKYFDNANIQKNIGVIDENLIYIKEPRDGDIYSQIRDNTILLETLANQEFDNYKVVINNQEVDFEIMQDVHFSSKEAILKVKLQEKENVLNVFGQKNGTSYSSQNITVYLEE